MNKIKKKIYLKFAENDKEQHEKEMSENVVTAPQSDNNNADKKDLSNPSDNSKKLSKKTKRRLIIWTIVILLVGGVIGFIIYNSVKKTEVNINPSEITQITATEIQTEKDGKTNTY